MRNINASEESVVEERLKGVFSQNLIANRHFIK